MPETEASIIIPVHNNWDFTRACLKALGRTTGGEAVEVIVVDNASTDVTPQGCPALGGSLFGGRFRYLRLEKNINFGPASNLGAKNATGNHLIFLNNDTVPLEGWYRPLLSDFAAFPDIAATGPLLLYPETAPLGHTVQHLGGYISPHLHVGHLYEGLPEASPLAKKRRFFQFITAACLVMPRALFFEAGMFDEAFINGYEDVELCARLRQRGRWMTVNPASRVIHHQGQTPGRRAHEKENSALLRQKGMKFFVPDRHLHLERDGLALALNDWQRQICRFPLPPAAAKPADPSPKAALARLVRNPFQEENWRRLIDATPDPEGRASLLNNFASLFPSPWVALEAAGNALGRGDLKSLAHWLGMTLNFCSPPEDYLDAARKDAVLFHAIRLESVARLYEAWSAEHADFKTATLRPLLAACARFSPVLRAGLPERHACLFDQWRERLAPILAAQDVPA